MAKNMDVSIQYFRQYTWIYTSIYINLNQYTSIYNAFNIILLISMSIHNLLIPSDAFSSEVPLDRLRASAIRPCFVYGMYTYIYICIHTYIHMYILYLYYIYIRIYIYVYTYMYVYYVHICLKYVFYIILYGFCMRYPPVLYHCYWEWP